MWRKQSVIVHRLYGQRGGQTRLQYHQRDFIALLRNSMSGLFLGSTVTLDLVLRKIGAFVPVPREKAGRFFKRLMSVPGLACASNWQLKGLLCAMLMYEHARPPLDVQRSRARSYQVDGRPRAIRPGPKRHK